MRSGVMQPWLIDDSSLTARLKARYPDLAVQPVLIKNTIAFNDESALIGLKAVQHALVRDVLLIGNNMPVVFAHSVLPKSSLRGPWNGLGKLGNKPLGAALFANPQVKRAPLSYKKLSPHQVLYQKATQHLSIKPAYLWARRSVFSLNCANILVTEVFLPQLLSS
ncbi:MAG: chorismate--pyruvate lyase [Proteobacteria bacterium ST_bin12]|nr:MAG: chorismate--pyruvate lyase [Proteobacteria bacterium ST_bin12]